MSANNGVIKIGRKGIVKFAFGDCEPFEVDVVVVFNQWAQIDDSFREEDPERPDRRIIPLARTPEFYAAAREFIHSLSGVDVTVAEALDFAARLREQYDELADFFVPKYKDEQDSQDTSEPQLTFSEEPAPAAAS